MIFAGATRQAPVRGGIALAGWHDMRRALLAIGGISVLLGLSGLQVGCGQPGAGNPGGGDGGNAASATGGSAGGQAGGNTAGRGGAGGVASGGGNQGGQPGNTGGLGGAPVCLPPVSYGDLGEVCANPFPSSCVPGYRCHYEVVCCGQVYPTTSYACDCSGHRVTLFDYDPLCLTSPGTCPQSVGGAGGHGGAAGAGGAGGAAGTGGAGNVGGACGKAGGGGSAPLTQC